MSPDNEISRSRGTRKLPFIIIGLLLTSAVVLPWVAAFRSSKSFHFSYGRIDGREIHCVAVDGTHIDRYFCLVFDRSTGSRIMVSHGDILVDDRKVEFPAGQNIGFLRSDGQIQFATVSQPDITPDSSGNSEVYYVLGRVPKFKHFPFGPPRAEFVKQGIQGLN